MKKVLFVILGLEFSGAENVLIQYIKGNNQIDPYFIFIYQGSASREFENEFDNRRIIKLNLFYSKNELRIIPIVAQKRLEIAMRKVIKKIKPNVIYFNNTHEVILSRMVIKKINIPCIGHIHDMKESIKSFPKIYEARKAFEELNEVLTVSNACKESWECKKMKVVYNGLPDFYFNTNQKRDSGEHTSLTLGYVGMISDRKGFDLLAEIINSDELSVDWKIAYNLVEPNYKSVLKNIALKNNVKLYYKIPSSKMKEFYDTIDILIIPSRQDPLPTVALEAMARKKLVIGFKVGGIPELIGNSRLIVNEINSVALRNKIQEVLELPVNTRKEIAESIYNRSKILFSQQMKRNTINQIIKAQSDF